MLLPPPPLLSARRLASRVRQGRHRASVSETAMIGGKLPPPPGARRLKLSGCRYNVSTTYMK